MTITVRLDHSSIQIERKVFEALFDASIVSLKAGYTNALRSGTISYADMVKLAREAQIPHALFFAPLEVVEKQIQSKAAALLNGVTKREFHLNSRNRVRIWDVELIIRDLLRKQSLLRKHDRALPDNVVAGCLRKSKRTIAEDAALLQEKLGFSCADFREVKTEAAVELLIERLEAKQILVARSQKGFMPQNIHPKVKFSGLCVKDKKVPYIFVSSGEDEDMEPAGRRLFTLVLLAVFIAEGKFAPVTYSDKSEGLVNDREYQIAEEILMPSHGVKARDVSTLEAIREAAAAFRVTPSAFVMRAARLKLITAEQKDAYLNSLHVEFLNREKPKARPSLPINALRKYNGREFSRRMVAHLDAGKINASEFCRVVFLNKLKPDRIPDFRRAL